MKRKVLLFFCLHGLIIPTYPFPGKVFITRKNKETRKDTEEDFNAPKPQQEKTITAPMIDHIDQALNVPAVDTFATTKVAHFKDGKLTTLGNLHCLSAQPWHSAQEKETIQALRQDIKDGKFAYAPRTDKRMKHAETLLIIGLKQQEEQNKPVKITHLLHLPQSKL